MSISAVHFGNNTINSQQQIKQNNNQKQQVQPTQKQLNQNDVKPLNLTPTQTGLLMGSVWFGSGFAFERIVGAMFKDMKTSLKVSLGMNAIVGLVVGTLAYIGAKKEAKNAKEIKS